MKCLICNNHKIFKFLDLGKQPLANKYPANKIEIAKEDFFPLNVLFCENCKNFQLGTIVSRNRMFEDYYYLSSVNKGLVKHFEKLAKKLSSSKFVVDIGSNDGILLAPLKKLGVKAIGVDPSKNVSKLANDIGLKTLVSFFDMDIVKKIKKQYGKPDVIVASSIFTHVEDPHSFLAAAYELMEENTKLIIEVEYIGNILKDIQFERFYLDRIFYYSISSLKNLFEAHGMYLSDVEEIEPHGGSIRVTAKKNIGNKKSSVKIINLIKKEEKDFSIPKLEKFAKKVKFSIIDFKRRLEIYKKKNLRVAGYGAPARVSTLTNYGKIGTDLIPFIIDDSPLKQNRFSPGLHIPIVKSDFLKNQKIDILVVFAHEYLVDIKKKTNNKYKYIIPINF